MPMFQLTGNRTSYERILGFYYTTLFQILRQRLDKGERDIPPDTVTEHLAGRLQFGALHYATTALLRTFPYYVILHK
jgi:hypothetical protein